MILTQRFAIAMIDDADIYEKVYDDNNQPLISTYETEEEASLSIIDDYQSELTGFAEELRFRAESESPKALLEDFDEDDIPRIEWCVVPVLISHDTGEIYTMQKELIPSGAFDAYAA